MLLRFLKGCLILTLLIFIWMAILTTVWVAVNFMELLDALAEFATCV